jgi:hypothetical protein
MRDKHLVAGDLAEPDPSAILTFSNGIQRAKASAIGHVHCAQLSSTFVVHDAQGVHSLLVLPIARTASIRPIETKEKSHDTD